MEQRRQRRHRAVSAHKQALILEAARHVFQAEGLEGASLRAIAAQAGYAPAALYSHFDSKEAIYAEVLRTSLAALGTSIGQSVAEARTPEQRLHAAAMAFFGFYAENPCDLDLGFYLLRGGMRRAGLGRARRATQCCPRSRAVADRRGRRGAGCFKIRRENADGGYLRSRCGIVAASAHRSHPHFRSFCRRSDGGLCPGANCPAPAELILAAAALDVVFHRE